MFCQKQQDVRENRNNVFFYDAIYDNLHPLFYYFSHFCYLEFLSNYYESRIYKRIYSKAFSNSLEIAFYTQGRPIFHQFPQSDDNHVNVIYSPREKSMLCSI